jgi:hypothetical protein
MAEAIVDQAAMLEDATKRVKEQAFYMKHAMVSASGGNLVLGACLRLLMRF